MDKENVVCIHNRTLFSHEHRKPAFATTQTDPEGFMLRKVSQRETNPVCSHICGN